MSILTIIILFPLLGALGIAFVPASYRFAIRLIALFTTAASCLLSLVLFYQFIPGMPGYQFEQVIPWVKSLGIGYHVGVDGINVGLVVMGAIVAFAAACL